MWGMGIWRLITTDPSVTAIVLMVGFYIIQASVGASWPFVIAYSLAGYVAIRAVKRRLLP
jgi:hypothetical protein